MKSSQYCTKKGVVLMKNKYGIGFFAAAIITVLAVSSAYQLSYQKAKERAEAETKIEKEQETAKAKTEPSVRTEGSALKEDCYYLMEVNGYIVVYLSDKKTPYEYTDIRYDELPAAVREEIRNGKYIEDTATLYGFLENYSS